MDNSLEELLEELERSSQNVALNYEWGLGNAGDIKEVERNKEDIRNLFKNKNGLLVEATNKLLDTKNCIQDALLELGNLGVKGRVVEMLGEEFHKLDQLATTTDLESGL